MRSKVLLVALLWLCVASAAAAQTYPVIWSDLLNATVTAGNTLTKTSGLTAS